MRNNSVENNYEFGQMVQMLFKDISYLELCNGSFVQEHNPDLCNFSRGCH